jgi:hypothetical protein
MPCIALSRYVIKVRQIRRRIKAPKQGDRRQLELPVVLPHLGMLPGPPHVNVTGLDLDMPPFLSFDGPSSMEVRDDAEGGTASLFAVLA